MAAPVVFCVYARPEHTLQSLEALKANTLALSTDLFVFSDGPRDYTDAGKVDSVRQIVRNCSGFRNVEIIERETNVGLSKNIVDGITTVLREHGRVIVVEDDLITSRSVLLFLNNALDRYERQKSIWHVGGWNYPISADGVEDTFFWRVMYCWSWGTWANRWVKYQKDVDRIMSTWTVSDKERFNLDGAIDFWRQIVANGNGKIDTWTVFWYATVFENNGLCLNPTKSLVLNIGHDNSGEHSGHTDVYTSCIAQQAPRNWPSYVAENTEIVRRIKEFCVVNRRSKFRQIMRKLRDIARK